MAPTVEDFSTPCKREWRDLLYRVGAPVLALSAAMDASLHKQQVGERLRLVREALNMSQQRFAEAGGVTDKSKLSHWERGKHYPDPLFIAAVSRRFGVSADWLYSGDPSGLRLSLAESLQAVEAASKAE